MKTAIVEIEGKVDELLTCLELDIRHIEESLVRLNELRTFIIKRDDAALGRLLESIRTGSEDYRNNETRRQSIRKELADAIDCEPKQMTLSVLESHLPESKSRLVAQTKARLRALTLELRKEHLSTSLLLAECARFNNVLLRSVFEIGKTGVVSYNSNGSAKRQIDTTLVDMKF